MINQTEEKILIKWCSRNTKKYQSAFKEVASETIQSLYLVRQKHFFEKEIKNFKLNLHL